MKLAAPRFVPLVAGAVALSFLGARCGGAPYEISGEGPRFGVLAEEFDGPAGAPPDPALWTYDVGGSGWGNGQLEYDTARTENVSLDGQGHLAIVARRESYLNHAYTSARIVTRGLYEQQYGRFAARVKLPAGRGIWPAVWLLGSNLAEVSWPRCGEIDVVELKGGEGTSVRGSMHGPGYSGGDALTASYSLPTGRFDDDFHVFAVDWYPDHVDFRVDDQLYERRTKSDVGTHDWVFDHPFYIILNVAVGGTFVDAPDSTTQFPQTMLVDWVRVTSPP